MEIELIYRRKGFSGATLQKVVDQICSKEDVWLATMMDEELGLSGYERINPVREAVIVFVSALVGSIVPLLAFFAVPLLSIEQAMAASVAITALVLFVSGAVKTKWTAGNWWKAGLELLVIGVASGIIGFAIGVLLGAPAA